MSDPPVDREERLKRIQKSIARMPSLSTTVTKVLEICNRPDTSPNDLNKVISLDPVLTGQVLKLINSAYYSLPNEVTSLTRAIIMLGLNTVKNLALSTAVLETIGGKESFRALPMDAFWTHSISTGVTAKTLALLAKVPVSRREEYFVAGLLHDLGKIPLNNRFPEEYLLALEMARVDGGSLKIAEQKVFGVDHCMVGGMIAEKWQLSETVRDSLTLHHNPGQAGGDSRPMVAAVGLANLLANWLEARAEEEAFPADPLFDQLLAEVGMGRDILFGLPETVASEVEKAKVFLQVTRKG